MTMEPRMTSQPRVLIVEDCDDDAQLLLRELRFGGLNPSFRRVETIAGVREAFKESAWDVVISDYNLPQQSFTELMQAIRAIDADVPVIVVSSSIGEENAVALMRQGVADFLFKGSLTRLIPAIERELAAVAAKTARRESDQRFRDIVEVSGDWIWETDEQHRYTFFSNRYEEAEWADPATSLGKTPWEVAGADMGEDEHWQAHLSDREAHQAFRNFLFSFVSGSGPRYHISMSGVPVFDRNGAFRGYRGTATDQTPVVAAFWRAEEAEALLRDAVDSISEGFIIFDPDDRIVMANEAFRKLYASVADFTQPGVAYEDLLQAAVERGVFLDAKGRESEWLANRIESHRELAGSIVQRLSDGRWVLVTEARMSNGGIAGLRMDITALKRAEAQRDHLAVHDAITGLPNKSMFTERLQQAIMQAERSAGSVEVICLELTSLHDIRDSRGLDAGDLAIREVAHRLRETAAPGEFLSHIGGGQFLVLRVGFANDSAAMRSVEALLTPFAEAFRIDDTEVPFRVAVGASVAPSDGADADTIIRNATTAMRRAKRTPAERYCFYNAEMTKAAVSRATLEADLRHAIDKDELFLLYQPQVSTHSYKLVGAEALIRWRHPTRGLIGPRDFIPIAEETGLITPIGEHVLKMACRQARAWRDAGSTIPVSVNLSAVQLAEQDLGRNILSIVRDAGIPPEAITLELTESAILRDADAAARTMNELAAEGMGFALDDFGMEHSALSHLSDLPFDVLKIDRAFVMRMVESRGHAALLQAIVAMIHSLGLTAIAEGVEQATQLLYLQAYGCDSLQGFLFARPMPPEELEPFLSSGILLPSIGDGDMPKMEDLLLSQPDAA
jgi:diguanylate cyclase (GGDEF)-like protein/PAS domain S-box-containing protein